MRQNVIRLLAQKGQSPVKGAIHKSIQDFKSLCYPYPEIKDTIREIFFGLDGEIDQYIIYLGY